MDAWSLAVFAELKGWAEEHNGSWSAWEPGYLLLEINAVGGSPIEPLAIYTADEEVTVTFGYWENHFPWQSETDDAATAACMARDMAEGWISGDVKTAVAFDAAGSWCGSRSFERSERSSVGPDLAYSVRNFRPARIELRSAERSGWEEVEVAPEWLRERPLSPDRLP